MPASPSPATCIGGALNDQGAPRPTGGASEIAYILALKYVTGPLTVGIQAEEAWYQGDVVLTGLSQRRARGITFGGTYTVAPGFTVFAEYLWQDIQQAGFNFVSGARGFTAASGGSAQQQRQDSGLPDRQRDQLLSLESGPERAAGSDPRRSSLFWSECGVAGYLRAADLMLLCPVSCHPLKLGMEIAGAKVAVSGGHLDARMAEDSA